MKMSVLLEVDPVQGNPRRRSTARRSLARFPIIGNAIEAIVLNAGKDDECLI
jgi:hypothetical protein